MALNSGGTSYVCPELQPILVDAEEAIRQAESGPGFSWNAFMQMNMNDPLARISGSPQWLICTLVKGGVAPREAFLQVFLENNLGRADFSGGAHKQTCGH